MTAGIGVSLLKAAVVLAMAAGVFPALERGGQGASLEASSLFDTTRQRMLVVGEELHYKVSYAFFNLGKIVVRVVDRREQNGRVIYRTRAIIDSAPGLPFVDLHIRFTSEFDEELFSYMWIAEDSTDEKIEIRRLVFDYDSSRVFVGKGVKRPDGTFQIDQNDTVAITRKCQDGLSLFYFARANVRQRTKMNAPTFIEKKQVNTFFDFTNILEEEEIDSVRYPIEVVEFEGRADFVGVFGLTGGFEGRFTNDGAAVPIVAWMKVILGSIKVTLTEWHRPAWVPPEYREKS